MLSYNIVGAGKQYHPADIFIITNMGQSIIKMCDISIYTVLSISYRQKKRYFILLFPLM